jgi:hypothetical protein
MPGALFSDVDTFGNLIEKYSDDKRYQERVMPSLYKKIRTASKGEVDFDGKNFNIAVNLQLNEAYAAINDGERLPDADIIKGVFAQYRPKLHYATMEATHFAGTRGHNGGRVGGKYLDEIVKSSLLAMTSGISFDLYGNGRGFRASVLTATPAASSFTVGTATRLRTGMRLDWYDSTYTTLRGQIKIATKGIDRLNRTVYIDSAYGTGAVPAGAVATDVLVVVNALAAGEPTDGRYIAGLGRITDNTVAYGGLDPATYAQWQSINLNASSGNLTQILLQQQLDNMFIISEMYPNHMVIPTIQKRSYLNQFLNQRRFTSNNFDTGASSLSFDPVNMGENGKNVKPKTLDILEDPECDADTVYFWSDNCLMIGTDMYSEPTIADEDGNEFRKRIGYDSEQGFMRYWANTVTPQRNGIGKIFGLNVPAGNL